jgi:quercetin dioxygenase-like cupin family protein
MRRANRRAGEHACPLVLAREAPYPRAMSIEKGTPSARMDLFGGRGEVRIWSLLEQTAGPFTAILSCELAPHASVGSHVQEEFPEAIIGLEGEGRAHVNQRIHALGAGDVVYLPLGSVLAIENLSRDLPLRYLIVKARE